VEVPYGEGVAIHIGPEPCADARKGAGEASAGECTGQPLNRERPIILGFSTKIIPPIKKVWNCGRRRRWPTGASVDLDEASRRLSAGSLTSDVVGGMGKQQGLRGRS
jgi:hypothetical protein